jgi:hypothetical protein
MVSLPAIAGLLGHPCTRLILLPQFTVILHFARTDENPYILTATLRGHLLSVRKPQLRFIVRGSKGTYSKYGIDVQEEQMQSQGAKSFSSDDAGREPAGLWGELELAEENGDISSNRYVDT